MEAMDITHLSFLQILLLISPLFAGIAIFGYLLWSDKQHDRKLKSGSTQNK